MVRTSAPGAERRPSGAGDPMTLEIDHINGDRLRQPAGEPALPLPELPRETSMVHVDPASAHRPATPTQVPVDAPAGAVAQLADAPTLGLVVVRVRVPPAPPSRARLHRDAAPFGCGSAQQLPHHRHQRPERLAAVADRVLLRRGEFRAGAGLAVGLEDRVVAEAARAGRGVAQGAASGGPRRRVPCRRAGRGPPRRRSGRRGGRRRCRRAGRGAGPGWPGRRRGVPAQRAEKMPGAPPRTSTQRPESSATAGRPVAWARAWALRRAFSAKVTPVSLTSGMSG